ncbi:MAG: AbrB family transcriptional regulator [Phyllobacteriaceae bacterium]|jgi:antitoxin PrlF|nr:AbrB family transcriptional regulator [Phyllobacteriaceae bacterium]
MSDAYSKISSKSQTVVPRPIREKLGLKPGDLLRYRQTRLGIIVEKVVPADDDPFAVFTEWSSEADDEAYADL